MYFKYKYAIICRNLGVKIKMKKEILEFIRNNFISGSSSVQLKNWRNLVTYLDSKKYKLDSKLVTALLAESPELNEMTAALNDLNEKGDIESFNNDNIAVLISSYYLMSNTEEEIKNGKSEEGISKDEEFTFDYNVINSVLR